MAVGYCQLDTNLESFWKRRSLEDMPPPPLPGEGGIHKNVVMVGIVHCVSKAGISEGRQKAGISEG